MQDLIKWKGLKSRKTDMQYSTARLQIEAMRSTVRHKCIFILYAEPG